MAGNSKGTKKKVIKEKTKKKVTHSVNKIKENEKKYTIMLVAFFMIAFAIIGFFALRIQNRYILDNLQTSIVSSFETASYGETITLDDDDIMIDSEGVNSKAYTFSIQNENNECLKYKIRFTTDENIVKLCGCNNKMIDYKYIKYSLDGVNVKTFNDDDMVIYEGVLDSSESKDISVRLWINDEFNNINNNHFHGHFVLEEIR